MELTYGGQTIELFSPKHLNAGAPNKIMLKLSGGLDSAALLYLICYHFPDIEVHLFTGKDLRHSLDTDAAIKIVKWMKRHFKNHKILSHDIFTFDNYAPEILDEVKELVDKDPSYYQRYRWPESDSQEESMKHFLAQIAKPRLNNRALDSLEDKYRFNYDMSGETMNPPTKDMKNLGFYDLSEKQRNDDSHTLTIRKSLYGYHPFVFINKKFIAGVYKEHNLMKKLFPLAVSCVAPKKSKFTKKIKPCEKCFWCQERHWAFGQF